MMPLRQIFSYNDYYRNRFIEAVAKSVPHGSRVLDAGAGTCKYKPFFSHCDYKAHDFARYEGSDHKYGELDYVGDITSIPVADGSFDYVICTEVLEHVLRPDLAITELARVLKRGGTMVLTAPLGSGIHMPPYHFYGGFTPFWYEHFLFMNGLELQECLPNGGFFKLYAQESQRFLSMMTPRSIVMRAAFFPLKVVLAIWFRMVVPVACHYLDRVDKKRDFTAGYFVQAIKR